MNHSPLSEVTGWTSRSRPVTRVSKDCRHCTMPGTITCSVCAREINVKAAAPVSRPGKGRIQVFKRASETWEHTGTIRLPKAVRFKDYSSLDFRNGLLAVISQATSAMWIGRLNAQPGGTEDLLLDDGWLYLFPRDDKGRIMYCNPEGVAWLGNDRLAVVSDKWKNDQPKRCARHDQSIHIFRLPAAGLSTD